MREKKLELFVLFWLTQPTTIGSFPHNNDKICDPSADANIPNAKRWLLVCYLIILLKIIIFPSKNHMNIQNSDYVPFT